MNNQHLIDHNYFLPVIYENIEQDSVDGIIQIIVFMC